ncbi:MAG: hypothetical protein A4E47_00299 [Methanosaeta sp. PtaU1.Bin028]|nr:MAG: hypothetical protein A4E47_00299 [Methanosaeta sp. PtaU1.Bin028]
MRGVQAALLLLLALMAVLAAVAWAEGPTQSIPPPTPVSSGGGGGHRTIDFDRIFKALEDGKTQKPQKFEQLKKLLYIEPFTTEEYLSPRMALYTTGNETISRSEKANIYARVENPNPIQIRRAYYLYLDVLEPGATDFRQVNSIPQIIQINDYTYDKSTEQNFTVRTFPDLTDFKHLKEVGPVVLRMRLTDGLRPWTSKNLTLTVTNNPPNISNLTIQAPTPPRYNDPIVYRSEPADVDGDLINLTIHVLSGEGGEVGNASQDVRSGQVVDFRANEYGFFSKADAGKNFSYYYSFGDGINVSETELQQGPNLRRSALLYVDNPRVMPEDENQYWWQNYNFSIDMKNQESGEAKVAVTLLTNTPSHPWKRVASKEVVLGQDRAVVSFNVRPFDVLDANQTFSYRFMYTEPDQHQKDYTEAERKQPIGAKLVKYHLVSLPMFLNLGLLLLLTLLAGMVVERRFYR